MYIQSHRTYYVVGLCLFVTGETILMDFAGFHIRYVSFSYLLCKLPFETLVRLLFPNCDEIVVAILYGLCNLGIVYGIFAMLNSRLRLLGWILLGLFLVSLLPTINQTKFFI